jgi:hypothetical protein
LLFWRLDMSARNPDDAAPRGDANQNGARGGGTLPLGARVPDVVRRVKRADERLVAFVEERPIAALCVAVGIGYLLGRAFTKLT